MADLFQGALDTIYAHSGVSVTLPFAPGSNNPLVVRALHEDFDPANPPLGTEVSEVRVGEERAIYSFRRGDVPDLLRGTILEAPETADGPVLTWKVESLLRKTAMEIKVLVRVQR